MMLSEDTFLVTSKSFKLKLIEFDENTIFLEITCSSCIEAKENFAKMSLFPPEC